MPRSLLPALALALMLSLEPTLGRDRSLDADAEFEKASTAILCDCGCHPQSVKECACGRAAEMRREMAGHIEDGMSGAEIIALYVAEKGEQIRVIPTASGFNLVAWLGPLVLLVLASGGLVLVLSRWRRRTPDRAGRQEPQPSRVADEIYESRLAQALKELE